MSFRLSTITMRAILAAGIALGLIAVVAGHLVAEAGNSNGNNNDNANHGVGHTPITICHWVPAHGGSYVTITIDDDGLHGHGGHDNDIIPAPAEGCPSPAAATPSATRTPEVTQSPGETRTPVATPTCDDNDGDNPDDCAPVATPTCDDNDGDNPDDCAPTGTPSVTATQEPQGSTTPLATNTPTSVATATHTPTSVPTDANHANPTGT